jgi:hypothetical protein
MGNTQWRVIVTGQTAYYPYGIWAPDGAHLLVINFDGGRAELLGRDGSLVRAYDHAVFAAWIDSERFLLLTYSNAHSGEQASAVLGSVASRATVPEQVPFGDALPNGGDAVAFVSSGCDMGCDQWSYAVWSPENGTTARQSGEPVAWSADGQRLFVIHGKDDQGPPTGAPGRSALVGWLEVVSWPGLDSIAQFHDETFNDDLDLVDPSGRYMAFLPNIDTASDLSILDTSDGDVTDLHTQDSLSAWGPDDLVSAPSVSDATTTDGGKGDYLTIVPSRGTATGRTFDGAVDDSWANVGGEVTATPDGSMLVFWDAAFSDSRSFITVVANGVRTEIEPIPLDGYVVGTVHVSVAPDGQALVVDCTVNPRSQDEYQHVVFVHPL